PKPPALTCKQPFTYDFNAFYRAIGDAASAQKPGDERLEFVLPYVQGLTSVAQVAGAAILIWRQPAAMRPGLVQVLSAAIRNLPADPRQMGFWASTTVKVLRQLEQSCP